MAAGQCENRGHTSHLPGENGTVRISGRFLHRFIVYPSPYFLPTVVVQKYIHQIRYIPKTRDQM